MKRVVIVGGGTGGDDGHPQTGRGDGEARHPADPEFIEMIAESGAGPYACKASVDLFGLAKYDFVEEVTDVITVGEFYELAAGGQIVFT